MPQVVEAYGKQQRLVDISDKGRLDEMDPFQFLLASHFPMSHVSEIYAVLGKEKFIEFLDLFEGMTLEIPSRKSLETAIEHHHIFCEVSNGRSTHNEMAKKVGRTPGGCRKTAYQMRKYYSSSDVDIPNVKSESFEGKENRRRSGGVMSDRDDFSNDSRVVSLADHMNEPPLPAPDYDDVVHGRGDAPEEFLSVLAGWMNSTSSEADFESMRVFLDNHKKKHEVFAVGLANVRATRLAQMLREMHNKVVPEALKESRLRTMSNKDVIKLLGTMHKITSDEANAQWEFYKQGPSELPPLRSDGESDKYTPQNGSGATAVTKLAALEPASREKVRAMFEAVMKVAGKVAEEQSNGRGQKHPEADSGANSG